MPLEFTPPTSARMVPLMSITPYLLLAMEMKMVKTTGSSRTLGVPTGETKASSRSREASTCAVLLCATLSQLQSRRYRK
jgi:hypothetical protein